MGHDAPIVGADQRGVGLEKANTSDGGIYHRLQGHDGHDQGAGGAMSDQAKLSELILYIASGMERDRHRTPTRIKLAKLLFLSDFGAYARWGQPITGSRYVADRLGPNPVDELTTVDDLRANRQFDWEPGFDKSKRAKALRDPYLEIFETRELELVDELMKRYRNHTAKQLVDIAHKFPGWVFAWNEGEGNGTPIPLESVFWSARTRVSGEEEEHAARLGRQFAIRATR